MGDIKRKRSKFRRPKKAFDKLRIEEEKIIVQKYGLKNKKEIWKAEAEISKIRRRAKSLIPRPEEERKEFFGRLNHLGLKVDDIADVLALTKENWLDRRLQTLVFKKGLANTVRQARQFIAHKLVLVDGEIINKPSFAVKTDLENKISLKERKLKEGKQTKKDVALVSEKTNDINETSPEGAPDEGKPDEIASDSEQKKQKNKQEGEK